MNKLYLHITKFITILLVLIPFVGFSQGDQWYSDNQKAIDSLRKGDFVINVLDENNNFIEAEVSYSLKKHEFSWGTALASSNMNTDYWYAATARKYFNSGVTENAFKWSQMQPNNGSVNYDDVNHYIDWCEEVGWGFRGHALLWGSQNYDDFHPLQKWVKDLPWPAMHDTLKVRVQRETEYYKGIIKEYDVMNEATPGHADWLQRTYGDSINWNAFKWAHDVDSSAKLFINDYSIVAGSDFAKYMTLINEMLENGAPIDGIGVQAHFGSKLDPRTIKYVLDSLATLGLPIKFTEFDMEVGKNNMSELAQAKYYAQAMRAAFAHEAVNGFMFWGFWDDRHWRDEAGIFTEAKLPKIAADSVYDLIHTTWSSQGLQTVSSTMPLEVNGYFGDYEVEIEYNGEKRVLDIALLKENSGDTVSLTFSDGKYPSPQIINAVAFDDSHINLYFDSKVVTKGTELDEFKINSANTHGILSISQPSDDSTQVILELSDKVNYRHYLTASYFPGTIIGANGSEMEFFGVFEVDNRVPGFISGASDENGESVTLVFSDEMTTPESKDIESFEITIDEAVANITELGTIDGDATMIYLNIENTIEFGQIVKVSYEPGDILTTKDGVLSAFGPKLITNNVSGVGVDDVFDKNNVKAFYAIQDNKIVLENQSGNNKDYYYNIFNITGIKLYSGLVKQGEKIALDASGLNSGLVMVRFESMDRSVNNSIKVMLFK